MLRQYRVYYRRAAAQGFVPLKPFENAPLYSRAEVVSAVEHMRVNPHIEGIALRLGDEMFNVVSFTQEAEAPNAFKFETPAAASVEKTDY